MPTAKPSWSCGGQAKVQEGMSEGWPAGTARTAVSAKRAMSVKKERCIFWAADDGLGDEDSCCKKNTYYLPIYKD